MKLLNGGIHIFTQHPDLAMRAFYREAEQYRKDEEAHREGMEFLASLDDAFTERCQKEIESFRKSHPHLIVIQYPEAVSCFVERFFLYGGIPFRQAEGTCAGQCCGPHDRLAWR